jgi:hypothetical protein
VWVLSYSKRDGDVKINACKVVVVALSGLGDPAGSCITAGIVPSFLEACNLLCLSLLGACKGIVPWGRNDPARDVIII